MTPRPRRLMRLRAAGCLIALLGAGCSNLFDFSRTTDPTPVPTGLSTGQWTSISSAATLPQTCTNFRWTITEITGATGSGTFTATCLGTMQVAGTARGTLSGSTVTWTAEGTGTTPGAPPCPISLSGTATFDGTQFRIPYTGTTCLGPVNGAEILRKT